MTIERAQERGPLATRSIRIEPDAWEEFQQLERDADTKTAGEELRRYIHRRLGRAAA